MSKCFLSELKTFCTTKWLWVVFLVVIILGIQHTVNNINNAQSIVEFNLHFQEMLEGYGEATENSTVRFHSEMLEVYQAHSPQMVLNNTLAYMTVIGMLILPIVSAVFVGIEYSGTRVIKTKASIYTLPKVFLSKIVVIALSLIVFLAVHSFVNVAVGSVLWNARLAEHFTELAFENSVSISLMAAFSATFAILIFHSTIAFFATILFKNPIAGVVASFAIIFIPDRFSSQIFFFSIFNETFFYNSISNIVFNMPGLHSVTTSVAVLTAVFTLVLGLIFVTSKKQRN